MRPARAAAPPGTRPARHAAAPAAASGPGAAPDTRKPALRVKVSGRRSLAHGGGCGSPCARDELATVRVGGRLRGVARFRTARRQVAAGRRTVLTVRISRKAARKLRRTLRRKRVVAGLTILARDAAGNQRRVDPPDRVARRR